MIKTLNMAILERVFTKAEIEALVAKYVTGKKNEGVGNRSRFERLPREIDEQERECLKLYLDKNTISLSSIEKEKGWSAGTVGNKASSAAMKFIYQNPDKFKDLI